MDNRINALQKLTNVQLKNLLRLIGCPTSGSKGDLVPRLVSFQSYPRFNYNADGRARILSVDMGVRNLAFCVVDIQREHVGNGRERSLSPLMSVCAWKRIDPIYTVLEAEKTAPDGPIPSLNNPFAITSDAKAADPWAPKHLASITYSLLKHHLLTWTPEIMLIEQQRYRSGGGPGVFEWTLRVNKLESMLWAALETMKQENCLAGSKGFAPPKVSEVSPQRVASFWTDPSANPDADSTVDSKKNGSVNSKREKIDLVRSWLSTPDPDKGGTLKIDCGFPNSEIHLAIPREAEITNRKLKQLVNTAEPKQDVSARAVKKDEGEEDSSRKLDDLADCLLQATAWVAWESNRARMAEMSPEELAAIADALGS
jgi:cruciform cutting endonuclease 1